MSFYQRHPYLFWQLIGWGILAADFGFLVIAALMDFGEWCYPVMVFTFIGGLFIVAASPIIVRLKIKRLIPQNENEKTDRFFYSKVSAILMVRRGMNREAAVGILFIVFLIGFFFAAYILGEYVHLALGFASMVLALVVPFAVVLIHSSNNSKSFFLVESGEELVEITEPSDLRTLGEENPPTLIMVGEPSAMVLNFLRNWLHPYLNEEYLTLFRVPAPELCRYYAPSGILRYEDVLYCIPTAQLDLTKENSEMFGRECEIMGVLPFGALVNGTTVQK